MAGDRRWSVGCHLVTGLMMPLHYEWKEHAKTYLIVSSTDAAISDKIWNVASGEYICHEVVYIFSTLPECHNSHFQTHRDCVVNTHPVYFTVSFSCET